MRWLYLLAGLVALLTGAAHVLVASVDLLDPVMNAALPLEVRAGMQAMFHVTTLLFALTALACFWAFAHAERARPLGVFLGLLHLLLAGLFAAISWQWFHDAMALPLWTLLAPIGLFALLAAR